MLNTWVICKYVIRKEIGVVLETDETLFEKKGS